MLLLFFLDLDHFLAFIMPTVGAGVVWQAHLAAIAAGHHVGGFQRIVGTAPIAASGSVFALWMWGHITLLTFTYYYAQNNSACPFGKACGLYG